MSLKLSTTACTSHGGQSGDCLVSQFSSDHLPPKLLGVLELLGNGLIEAGQEVPQFTSYLALQGQKGSCFSFFSQPSSSPCEVFGYEEGSQNFN